MAKKAAPATLALKAEPRGMDRLQEALRETWAKANALDDAVREVRCALEDVRFVVDVTRPDNAEADAKED